ncbi:hypothetical protein [Cryptosporangium minutisporangium]|uniref:Uncharacterized protein n=1 Tax=Cryptosporangium minutisporangium TaxID=113569 RepID=A0ABP6SU88_9ACTN
MGPHQRAAHYGMVWARIDALPVANLRGVETRYSVGGSTRWVRSDVEYGAEADG